MATRSAIAAAFGSVVREHRLHAALSQEQLAEMASLHRNYVGMVKRGLSSPSLSLIVAISDPSSIED